MGIWMGGIGIGGVGMRLYMEFRFGKVVKI